MAELEGVLFAGLEALVSDALDGTRRELASLPLRAGGLAFGGLTARSPQAFLASWALTLREVAAVVGVHSEAGFRAKCPTVSAAWDRAEAALRLQGANNGRPVDWVGFLHESHPKLQGVWAKQAGQCRRTRLLATPVSYTHLTLPTILLV